MKWKLERNSEMVKKAKLTPLNVKLSPPNHSVGLCANLCVSRVSVTDSVTKTSVTCDVTFIICKINRLKRSGFGWIWDFRDSSDQIRPQRKCLTEPQFPDLINLVLFRAFCDIVWRTLSKKWVKSNVYGPKWRLTVMKEFQDSTKVNGPR